MPTYAIGDVQGCFDELQALLTKIRFDATHDRLWFVGDLVNRGPKSLAVLRYVRGLGDRAITVLGNHDLHLVAAQLRGKSRKKDTFDDVLTAPDRNELLAWLRRQPLVHAEGDWVLVHGAVAPQWTVEDALAASAEASKLIADRKADEFFADHMYGNDPDRWVSQLKGWDRLRFIINCCTRMRLCTPDGRLDLEFSGAPGDAPDGLLPWFTVPGRRSAATQVIFGHWSALGRVHWPEHRAWGLDTGCVWGRALTALRLEDRKLFQVQSGFKGSE